MAVFAGVPPMSDPRLSQHPVDILIRQIIGGGRRSIAGDIEQVVERIATAPFDPRIRVVPSALEGRDFDEKALASIAPSVVVHLLTRVFVDDQWSADTSVEDYVQDLRSGVRSHSARLGLYIRRGGHLAAVIADTELAVPRTRRGTTSLPHLLVLYSADRGIIISGYQFSAMTAVAMPKDVLWLR
jgi:hypothetical protein